MSAVCFILTSQNYIAMCINTTSETVEFTVSEGAVSDFNACLSLSFCPAGRTTYTQNTLPNGVYLTTLKKSVAMEM